MQALTMSETRANLAPFGIQFEFAKFEIGERAELVQRFPKCREWIERLTS